MPSAPKYLTDQFATDADACSLLTRNGYKLNRDWTWSLPSNDHYMSQKEADAIDYLIFEWDFGGIV